MPKAKKSHFSIDARVEVLVFQWRIRGPLHLRHVRGAEKARSPVKRSHAVVRQRDIAQSRDQLIAAPSNRPHFVNLVSPRIQISD
jgi:hypothetical protein